MSTLDTTAGVAPPLVGAPTVAPESGRLAAGALGLPPVLFCIVTGAAPLAAMMFNVPVAVLGGGYATPAAFLVATVVLTVFSVGYIEMSRRVSATGGFYTFITRGLGKIPGLGAGILIALCYVVFSAAVVGVMGYFFATTLNAWIGLDLPAWVYTAIGLAVMTAFGYFHIELTAKVLGVALVAEVLALLVLAVAIFLVGGDSGFSAKPLNPLEIFDNPTAISTFGAGAAGIAIFAAFWSWVGFEMAPNYAEESREPKKIAKAATYASVIGLGVFYVFVSYAFVTGWGTAGVGAGVNGQFEGTYGSAFYPLTDRYVGGGLTTILEVLIITSSFACSLAFYNTSARYLFSLSREKVLPAALSRTHPKHHSPHVASSVVSVLVGLYILGFALYDSSTEAFFLKLGTWTPLLGVLGILAVQALCCVAIVRYFMTQARDGMHWWKTVLAPIIGCLAQAGACYLLIANRGELAGAGDVFFVKAIPFIVLLVFLAGMGLAVWFKLRSSDTFARIGQIETDDLAVAGVKG